MEEQHITRREFLRELGVAGAGALVLTSPWLKAFADVDATAGEKLLNPLSETENLVRMIDRAGEIAGENSAL